MLKVAWEKLCALRYADFTNRMRKSSKKQQCVSQEIWESWQKAWDDPIFKRKRKIFAQNRRSETGDDGASPSRHIGGSISAIGITRLLENYSTARERIVSSQAESEAEPRIDELAVSLEAVGGEKKRKVYGIGSQASQFYCGSASNTSAASSGPEPYHSAEEFIALWARVDEQGAHRDVLTPPPQPLPSPLDPDTADDTLITPADTTTHLAGTPPSNMTLDRADDQPRRFDFGPF
ncbi:hypothetical protein JCGZ_03258 [Jatropha curcas]|uniref:Uncharacterized protein n=1 Tax=Jatropha curcas TaxID=180498 RepID=A0A067JD43_JATCU|nr:hypothetical protein JCGZ_03258 [Jatropha curcas]